ncbi:MAG: cytidine deaminase [bacterium]|nr:cytidine deaminase [bacterium]
MKEVVYKELTDIQGRALDESLRVLLHSYNPYSHFSVGACLITDKEELISGTNFENSAYGSTICAERAAILRANAMGVRRFKGIAIIARGKNFDTVEITGPCGSCRQVLYEVSQISGCNLEIILSTTKKDKIIITSIRELLPLAFGPLDIGVDISEY